MQHINDNTPGPHSGKWYAALSLGVLISTSDDVDILANSGCGMTGSLQRPGAITSSCVSGTFPADHTRVDNHYRCYNYACVPGCQARPFAAQQAVTCKPCDPLFTDAPPPSFHRNDCSAREIA